MMKKKMDIIDQKRLELNTYVAQYNLLTDLRQLLVDVHVLFCHITPHPPNA